MLTAGQVIRYSDALYRVDYVNSCRARIVPLAKRTVSLDDRTFESEGRGVNISPNSFVEIVTDIEAARTRLELAAVEAELAALKREAVVAPPIAKAAPVAAFAGRKAVGWRLGGATPDLTPGSLKAVVYAFVSAHPGCSARDIVAPATQGAVGACLDRFEKAGVLIRVALKS